MSCEGLPTYTQKHNLSGGNALTGYLLIQANAAKRLITSSRSKRTANHRHSCAFVCKSTVGPTVLRNPFCSAGLRDAFRDLFLSPFIDSTLSSILSTSCPTPHANRFLLTDLANTRSTRENALSWPHAVPLRYT